MNWWIIFITFLAVNLDFFFILIFLLERYNLRDVIIGYLGALLVLVTISFLLGKTLAIFLPEWILGILGILPIYMALHDNDEESTVTGTARSSECRSPPARPKPHGTPSSPTWSPVAWAESAW